MSKSKSIVGSYLLLMAKVLGMLLIVSLSVQLLLVLSTVYVSQQPAYVLQKNTGPVAWADSFDVEIEFNVPQQLAAGASVVVDIFGYFESLLEGTGFRTTTIYYTLYCNGQKAKTASNIINAVGVRGGCSNPGIVIPAKFLMAASNKLLVHANVDSVPVGTGTYSFLYRVDKIEVRVRYVDSDGDGVFDAIDLVKGVSNVQAFAAVGFFGVLPSVVIGKRLPRIRKS